MALAFSRAAAARASTPAPTSAPASAPPQPLRDDRFGPVLGVIAWALLVLMIVPEGFDYGVLATDAAPTAGGAVSRALWLALLGAGLAAVLWRVTLAVALLRWLNPFLVAFVVLAAASLAWSMDPPVTARRLIRVATVLAVSTGFVLMAWHARRFQGTVRPLVTLVLAGSLVFGLAWPELAIHQEQSDVLAGAWHGLASHKNGLGNLASLGLLFWCHAWLTREAGAAPALVGLGVALACLVLSRSSTSLVATAFTLPFLVLLLRAPPGLRRYMPWVVALFATALVMYALVLLRILPGLHTLLGPIGAITGKDMTFTGRTEIWDIMFEHIRLHPLLGTGHGAYWTGTGQSAPSFEFVLKLGFDPGSAHNGYLDVLNELGVVGLVVLLGYLVAFVTQALRLLPAQRTQAVLFLALFMQQAITNLAESRWFNPLSVDFVIMTLATAALARARMEQRLQRPAAAAPSPSPSTGPATRPSLSRGARP